jgi:superfamily II DNA helicase RecQ
VFAALKEWRSSTARAANVPAYVVFSDRTLAEVARRRPRTEDELLGVPGIGPVKVQRYGDALLRLSRQHRVG